MIEKCKMSTHDKIDCDPDETQVTDKQTSAVLTSEGHVVGMFHRDLRTMKTTNKPDSLRYQKIYHHYLYNVKISSLSTITSASTSAISSLTKSKLSPSTSISLATKTKMYFNWLLPKKSRSSRRITRLGEALVVGVCLLSVLRLPCIEGAPLGRFIMDRSAKPKWINPCNIDLNAAIQTLESQPDYSQISDAELVNLVLGQAKIALGQANSFGNEYVKHTFKIDFDVHHIAWKENHYEWLPKPANKSLGEKTSIEHLKTVQLDSSLVETFQYLQTFAVALEQIIWDLEDEEKNHPQHPSFLKSFKDAWDNINALLCEVQVAMVERDVKQRPDVTRDVMDAEYRQVNGDRTHRNLRDWVIYRDYINTLEYVRDVFEFIAERL